MYLQGITTYFSGNCVLSDAELAQEFLDEKVSILFLPEHTYLTILKRPIAALIIPSSFYCTMKTIYQVIHLSLGWQQAHPQNIPFHISRTNDRLLKAFPGSINGVSQRTSV